MEILEIKQQLPLARVLQHYGLKPDKNLRLHCPFHEDKTPSLQVYYKTHTAYCFSSNCKTHGSSMDVIDFVMHKENTDKHNALLKCAEIIHYYQGKVQHQQKPIVTNPAPELTMSQFAFRELQSNGELNSATSIKLESGQITSGQKTVKGPIASLACTTRGEVYEDNMSRVFLIAVDESTEQTKRIIGYQNRKAAGLIDNKKEQEIKVFLQKFISIIQPQEVINPFAEKIQLPEQAQKIRRLNDLFQSFVKMITIMNQYQRQHDERKRLITQIEDVETAVAVMFESIVLKVDELDGSLRQFYEQLKGYLQRQYNGHHQTAEFSLREIRQALKASKTQVFRYANDLANLEYIRQSGGYQNRGFTYKISYWDNYQNMREKIRQSLDEQVKALKAGTPRNASGTLEPA